MRATDVIRATPLVAIGGAVALGLLVPPAPAQAQWCAQYQTGGGSCSFSTFAQCRAAVSGLGGSCSQSPTARSAPTQREVREKPEKRRTVREQPRKKDTPRRVERPTPVPEAVPTEPTPAFAVPVPAPAMPAAAAAPVAGGMPENFAVGRKLILEGQYQAGIAAMQSLGFDDHPEIATYIGFANSKLGRADQARAWYDRALAANPGHPLALSFYGMLHAERGDLRRAQENLEKLRQVCGADCNEYRALEAVLESKRR